MSARHLKALCCSESRGWRVGCNPPSVLRRHPAKRATRISGRIFIDAYSPFHPGGRPFQRFHPAHSTRQLWHASSSRARWTFRFCSVAGALAPRPCGRPGSAGGRSFLKPLRLESRPPTRQPHNNILYRRSIKAYVSVSSLRIILK